MNEDGTDIAIRQAIGGDSEAIAWIDAHVASTDESIVVVMAALLDRDASRLDAAAALATTSRDRQTVEIARAHLAGQDELVDALAREHLVDYPDSLIVAWIASGAVRSQQARER